MFEQGFGDSLYLYINKCLPPYCILVCVQLQLVVTHTISHTYTNIQDHNFLPSLEYQTLFNPTAVFGSVQLQLVVIGQYTPLFAALYFNYFSMFFSSLLPSFLCFLVITQERANTERRGWRGVLNGQQVKQERAILCG